MMLIESTLVKNRQKDCAVRRHGVQIPVVVHTRLRKKEMEFNRAK
jgi:hypothetical protein